MDTKQLVEKFVKGEITEEQLEIEKAKLKPEELEKFEFQKIEADKATAQKELNEIQEGLKKARLARKNVDDSENLAGKLREENLASAKEQFLTELGIDKEEDIKAFEEGFKKFDSGNVTPENIIKDMRKYYAAEHSDDFFKLAKEKKQREQDAEEFNANNGGSNGGSGNGGEELKKASKEVREYIAESQKLGFTISVEQAERALAIKKNGGHIQ